MHKNQPANAVQTYKLGKRYGSFWALKNCDIAVPAGSITALVGANGAGKSTLLQLLAGLNKPTSGRSEVLKNQPAQTSEFLASVGYLAQEIPLYKQFDAEDYIAMGAHLNKVWDGELMRKHLRTLSIPLDRSVATLSGGQRAQVALGLALAKKPQLLLLDEPVAALDPLARRDFLTTLAQTVAETHLTVVMPSHLLSDLELVCDHLVLLKDGRVQLCDGIDHILETHKLLVGPHGAFKNMSADIVTETSAEKQSSVLVRLNGQPLGKGNWQAHDVSIEDVVLAYMRQNTSGDSTQQSKGGIR